MSGRSGLRIGIVTDTHLIKKLKKKYPQLFFDIGMSNVLLKRYDGELLKLDVADSSERLNFNRFIC